MVDAHLVAIAQHVDHQNVRPIACVVGDQALEKTPARKIRNAQPVVREMQAVGLRGVHVRDRRAQFDVTDAVGARALLQTFDPLGELLRVRQHDRLAVERVGRREHGAARTETAGRHRLDQYVDVAGMVEMLVRQDDRVEFARIARRDVRQRANQGSGPGIDVNAGLAEAHPHSAGGAQLACDDEAGAAAAEKKDGVQAPRCLTDAVSPRASYSAKNVSRLARYWLSTSLHNRSAASPASVRA